MSKVNEFWIRIISYMLIYIVFIIIHLSIFGISNNLLILLAVMSWVYSFIAYYISNKLLNKFALVSGDEQNG